jgi:hypothetical protein
MVDSRKLAIRKRTEHFRAERNGEGLVSVVKRRDLQQGFVAVPDATETQ